MAVQVNKYNLGCTIISTEQKNETNNRILCELFKTEFVYCKIDEVKSVIEEQIKIKQSNGYKPYFIQGGGHGNLGTKAYVDAFKDILTFEKENNIEFDYIFHASGTGTTQAGLVLGKIVNHSKANIVGISIARKLPRGKDVIVDSIKDYIKEFNIATEEVKEEDINFVDKYVLDSYGAYNQEIIEEIKKMMCTYGIPMDTTYVGKAFWGMKQFIKEKDIKDKNILFIHTGGAPIFFDRIKIDFPNGEL